MNTLPKICRCGANDPAAEDTRRKNSFRALIGWLKTGTNDPLLIYRRIELLDFLLNKPEDAPELMAEKRRELMERFNLKKSTLCEAEATAGAALADASHLNSQRQNEKPL